MQHFVFDQKYAKKGESRKKHRGAERVNASGDLVELVSTVLVNFMKIPVPQSLGGLTPPEVLSLRDTGPFTRDPMRVKLILDPDDTRQRLDKWFVESMEFVKQVMRRSGISDPRELSVAKIARSQAGRPQVSSGGATYFELQKPLLDTDTKSNADGVDCREHCFDHADPCDPAAEQLAQIFTSLPPETQAAMKDKIASHMGCVAMLMRGDGQSVITMARDKKYNPERTKAVVPTNGHLHSRGHFAFCANEGFHDAKYGRTTMLLSKDKVPKHIPNFENDSYLHCVTHLRDDLIGTLSYFLLDVKNPAPQLLLDDHVTYLSHIKKAGGIAAFESMRYSGIPLAHYILAVRAEDGDKACELEAFAFHACRAWAFKPVEARVLLISLLSSQTTHPKIAEIVKHSAFFNWLGRPGSSIDADRAMENVNRMQDERRGRFSAFESALEYTPMLALFCHVDAALDVADNGESRACDPLRESTINAANVIRKDLRDRLGDDLTIQDDTSPLFHTGGAPNTVDSTQRLSHRPWEFIWRVARGQSTGAGRGSTPESSNVYIDRFLTEHLWTSNVL